MRLLYGLSLCVLLSACDPGANAADKSGESPQTAKADAQAAGCQGCHVGGMSLAGKDAATVVTSVRAILAGSKAHPPLNLASTDDAYIRRLAEHLTASAPN